MIEDLDLPGVLLMEEAGRKSAEWILARYADHKDFLILAGPGNNGGDGFVIARYLDRAGKSVEVIQSHTEDRYQGDAAINLKALKGASVNVRVWEGEVSANGATVVIDALLGTGVNSELRGTILEMIDHFRDHSGPMVAIDMPSGMLADSGQLKSTPLKADHTLTFQLPKVCHGVYPAADFCGEVVVIDIGIWPSVVSGLGIQRSWLDGNVARSFLENRPRPTEGHKGTFGHALLIGGSSRYPGAIALSAHAALHIGAGLSTAVAPESSRSAIFGLGPEAIFQPISGEWITPSHLDAVCEWSQGKAVGIGPGWSTHPEVLEFFKQYLAQLDRPVVLDADALNLLAEAQCWDLVPAGSVITPHPGEMRRLLGTSEKTFGRIEEAEALARERNLVVVLKGAGTIVATPDHTWVNTTGNSGMGTGGAGDVLTGAITGLMAQGFSSDTAAALGVYLHGLAGDLAAEKFAENGVTASRIMEHLGPAMVKLVQHLEPKIPTL